MDAILWTMLSVYVTVTRCCCDAEPGHERALQNLEHYRQMIAEEEEELQRSRHVVDLHPQLKNERVLDGVRAAPDFNAYERLCRGEQLPRSVNCVILTTLECRRLLICLPQVSRLWIARHLSLAIAMSL